jgi:D-galactarolactone cycloisomerase
MKSASKKFRIDKPSTKPSGETSIRIEYIAVSAMAVPLPRVFHGSNYAYTHKKAIAIEIASDDGLVGQAYLGDDFGLGPAAVTMIRQDIEPNLRGADPRLIREIRENLRVHARNILGDRRIALHAQAAIDIALWDLEGQRQNKSLSRIWGGATEERPVICIAGYYGPDKTLEDYAEEALDLKRLGYGGIKLKVGGLTPGGDAQRAEVIRKACGEDFILAVDANQGWNLDQALAFVDHTEDLNIDWFEEPVHWENDIEDMAVLRRLRAVPLCAGQSELTKIGARRLMAAGAVDICNLHAGYIGGVTPWLDMAEEAAERGLWVAHTGEPQLSLQLMTAFEHGTPVEVYHPDRDPIFYQMVMPQSGIEDGVIRLPDQPGWGYNLDPDFIADYEVWD